MRKTKKGQVFEYWKNSKEIFIIDWGEPMCWACHKPTYSPLEDSLETYKNSEPYELWQTANELEICHIIPISLGGSDDPFNLVLLCKECHKKAPDTTSRELFIDWVRNKKEWLMDKDNELYKAIASWNITKEEANQIKYSFLHDSENIYNYIKENITSHAGKVKEVSFAAAALSYVREETK